MIDVLEYHPEADLVAVCDKYRPLLDEVAQSAEKAGIEVALYENFEDFFKHDMDAVILANYANEHAPLPSACSTPAAMLSEVLPCQTMAEAVALIEAVEASGKIYAYAETTAIWTRPSRCGGALLKTAISARSFMRRASTSMTAPPSGPPSPTASATMAQPGVLHLLLHPQHRAHAHHHRTAAGPGRRRGRMNPQFLKLGHHGGHAAGFIMISATMAPSPAASTAA